MFFVYNDQLFMPYIQNSSGHLIDLKSIYGKNKQKYYIIGFMNNYNGKILFDNNNNYEKYIEYIRNKGGDVVISFGGGGSNVNEIALSKDVDFIYKSYKYVIDKYNLKWIDLDIEGSVLKDKEANTKRNEALVKLKKTFPDLIISYTLPVETDGLHSNSLELLKDCKYKKLNIDVVNLMCMDFGSYYAPQPDGNMGYYSKLSCEKTMSQLINIGLTKTKLGITVMIGRNDVQTEIFTQKDAEFLVKYAKSNDKICLLSYWSMNRDNGNGVNKATSCNYSSIKQEEYEFCSIFQKFNWNKNIALNKRVRSSSVEDDKEEFASKWVVDGNIKTRWASKEFKQDQEWIEVDLKNFYYVNYIKISWEVAYAKKYKILLSNDRKNYKEVYVNNDNTSLSSNVYITPELCRYMKIQCIEKATKYGFSIYEIEIYNR